MPYWATKPAAPRTTVRPITAAGTTQSGTPPSWKPLSSSHLSRSGIAGSVIAPTTEPARAIAKPRLALAKYGTMRRRRSRSGDAGVVMAAIIGARFRGSLPAAYNRPACPDRPMPARPAFGHRHRQERGGADRGLPGLGGLRRRMDRRRRFDRQRRHRRAGPPPRRPGRSTFDDWPGFGAQKQRALDRATGGWVLSHRRRRAGHARAGGEHPRGDRRREAGRRRPTSCRGCRASAAAGSATATGIRTACCACSAATGPAFRRTGCTSACVVEGGPPGRLDGDLLHDTMPTPRRRPRQDEPLQQRERGPAGRRRAARRPRRGARPRALWAFLRGYVVRRGFLDGAAGFALATYVAEGTFWRYLKIAEHARRLPTEGLIRRRS